MLRLIAKIIIIEIVFHSFLCLDINECDESVHECDTDVSTCKNNYGSYTCECKHGYLQEDDQNKTCIKQGLQCRHSSQI